MAVATPLLDTIKTPDDLRRLDESRLRQLADELRAETVDAASETGGHFGAGLDLVRRIAEKHGGAAEAHSGGPGQGSEFVLRLPLSHPVAVW